MATEVINVRIEVDEEKKEIDVKFDCEFPDEKDWHKASFAQKLAAIMEEVAGSSVEELIKHETKAKTTRKSSRYPCRCRIVENDGQVLNESEEGVLVSKTPEESIPKLGRTGTAHLCEDGRNVRIDLDDGSTLMGYECWWEPIADAN